MVLWADIIPKSWLWCCKVTLLHLGPDLNSHQKLQWGPQRVSLSLFFLQTKPSPLCECLFQKQQELREAKGPSYHRGRGALRPTRGCIADTAKCQTVPPKSTGLVFKEFDFAPVFLQENSLAHKKKPKKLRRVSSSPDHPSSRSGPIAPFPETGRDFMHDSCRISLVAETSTRELGKPASREGQG